MFSDPPPSRKGGSGMAKRPRNYNGFVGGLGWKKHGRWMPHSPWDGINGANAEKSRLQPRFS